MKNVSDRVRNPFGMRPRCETGDPVCGYGDPAADFHVVGDRPGTHGGARTGVPFTDTEVGRALQGVLHVVGLLDAPYADLPEVSNLFLSYLYLCPLPPDEEPSERGYADHDRFFDAELRAVNAHILLPVGRRATDRVLERYTTRSRKVPRSMKQRHATEVRGRGFLVVPIMDPRRWSEDDRIAIESTLERILDSDYRQTKGVATLIG